MDLSLIALLLMALFLTDCARGGRGSSKCATDLTYVTNRFTTGDQAIRHAGEYRVALPVGKDEFMVDAILDTASAVLVINEKNFDFGEDTIIGQKPYAFGKGLAINAKDDVDIACTSDIHTRFALAAKESGADSSLGLAYANSGVQIAPFFDQLVREGLDDVFSLALCGYRGHSRVLLGGVDEWMQDIVGNFIPIIEKTAYVVPALSLRLAGRKKVIGNFPSYRPDAKAGIRTIIDSASAFMLLPSDMAVAMADTVMGEAKALGLLDGFPEGFFRTERANSTKVIRFLNLSQIRQFPTFEIIFLGADSKDKALELSPLYYFKEMDGSDRLWRTFAIRETSGDVVLGQPFLENHYLYVDRAKGLIGFGNIDIACSR